ncbi:capsule biosynthesis protein [Paenirhodobacter sp.]|uniref:capsule biosynthesis protein n=1 Tax=Paenirhodobacter sp. TaxID=1965326 RepID=UPI003B3CB403
MTTAPKATRYRIRRVPIQPAAPEPAAAAPSEDGFDPAVFTPVDAAPSGWQLRLARRIARKHGIEVATDAEAVAELRARGIDPFDRAQLLSFEGVPEGKAPAGSANESAPPLPVAGTARKHAQVPQVGRTVPPPAPPLNEAERVREIMRIQQDIAQRRRRKLLFLFARLAFFVLLPTLVTGWYYFAVATPMFATKSEFVIQKAEGVGSSGGGLGGLFAGTQLGSNQDSITVQSYLQSRDAMLKLDAEHGFKAHFQQPVIDRLQRLPSDSSNEQAYKLYQRNVKIGYDPSEGVIRMEVIAADPETSKQFSQALISYAEQQVDRLTSRLREDQMRGARESYEDAEAKVIAAQDRVLQLQQKVGVLDPVSENSLVMEQIATLQTQLQAKRLELNQLLDNSAPNAARVQGARGDIARLEQSIAGLRQQLTTATDGTTSLAAVTGQLRIAEADLETRQGLLAAAAQQMEASRIEANKQVRFLETGVRPIAPDEATYPRAFEYTLLAFLIFSGIYLMLSLTVSILREQVSS